VLSKKETDMKITKEPVKLTNSFVEKLVCPADAKYALVEWDRERKGFGVRVSSKGTRTYFLQFRVKGSKQERQVTIGRHNDPWRVDDARAKAGKIKEQMMAGTDPVLEAQRVKKANEQKAQVDEAFTITLRQIMEHYLTNRRTSHGTPLRANSQRDIRRHVTISLKDWADQPIANITRDACVERFNALSVSAHSQANTCMINLRALCNYARELYANEDGSYKILVTNPVERMLKVRKLNKEAVCTGRIPLDHIGAVWNVLRKRSAEARLVEDRTAADWLSFVLMTGTRRTESGCLLWSNVDLEAGTFHLPADVVKNHNGITLPMCTALRDMLKARKEMAAPSDKVVQRRKRNPDRERSDYVFPSYGKTGYITNAQATMKAVIEAAGVRGTIHDLRRTATDICKVCKVGEQEERQLLNHKSGSDVHAKHYSNNPDPATLLSAVESMGTWVTEQAAQALAKADGKAEVPPQD